MDMNSHEKEVLMRALCIYSEWLNMHGKANGDDWDYFPSTFLEGDGSTEFVGKLEGGYYDIFHFIPYDGDEGGPSELTVFTDRGECRIVLIIQTFDTYSHEIFNTTEDNGSHEYTLWRNIPEGTTWPKGRTSFTKAEANAIRAELS